MEDDSEIRSSLREFKKTHGRELLIRHGAHSMGIGWKEINGKETDQMALIFYVKEKQSEEDLDVEPIPSTIIFTPADSDAPVILKTDVVETPQAEFE